MEVVVHSDFGKSLVFWLKRVPKKNPGWLVTCTANLGGVDLFHERLIRPSLTAGGSEFKILRWTPSTLAKGGFKDISLTLLNSYSLPWPTFQCFAKCNFQPQVKFAKECGTKIADWPWSHEGKKFQRRSVGTAVMVSCVTKVFWSISVLYIWSSSS